MAVASDVADYSDSLNAVASDAALSPDERVAQLRRLRARILDADGGEPPSPDTVTLLGQADTYIGDLELQREADAMRGPLDQAAAREDADIRDMLIAQGVATDDELVAAGWPSHDDLDAAAEDGTLSESVLGMFKEVLHPRDRMGEWRSKGLAAVSKRRDVARAGRIKGMGSIADQLAAVKRFGLNDWPQKGPVAQRLLGDAKDTQQLHTVALPASPGTAGQKERRAYTDARKATHDQIIGGVLGDAVGYAMGDDQHPYAERLRNGGTLTPGEVQEVAAAAKLQRNGEPPRALFLAGGPASGKTSALDASPELRPDGAVLINPDDLKALLPEYGQMIQGRDKFAASGVHEESSDLGKRLQQEATAMGLNTVVDGTGDSKKGKFTGKMQDMDKAGYDVSALYVTIPTDEAVVRATTRAMKSGRWVPEPELRAQHKNVSANFQDVSALPFLKDVKVYDNSGTGDPSLIAQGGGGDLSVLDRGAYDTFLRKADESLEEAVFGDGNTVEDDPFGEFSHDSEEDVPVEDWVPEPVFDSADYLDRQPPVYEGGDGAEGGDDEQAA